MKTKTEYGINGKTWTITYDNYSRKVVDISVNLSREEYLSLKSKLADPGIDHKSSSSVEILKNGFAKARGEATLEHAEHRKPGEEASNPVIDILNQIEELTTNPLEELSRSLNGSYDDPIEKLKALQEAVSKYDRKLKEMTTKLSTILEREYSPEQRSLIMEDISALRSTLSENNAKLLKQIHKLKNLKSELTHEQVDLFLSAQNRGNHYSLGHFIGEQTTAICKSTINITSVLQDRYLLDIYYKKNDVTGAFIEASSELRIRHESLYGARYVNTQSETNSTEDLPERADFSLLPFMTGTTASDLDRMICLVSGEPLSQRSLSRPSKTRVGLLSYGLKRAGIFIGLYTLAPAAEIVISAAHLALALPTTLLRVLAEPLAAAGIIGHHNFLDKYIENLNGLHRFSSPIRFFKSLWNEQYQRLDDTGNPVRADHPHQKMLTNFNQLQNESSLVNAVRAVTTPDNTIDAIRLVGQLSYQAVGTIGSSLGALITSPLSLFKKAPTDEEIFKKHDENYHMLKPIMESLIAEAERTPPKTPSTFPSSTRQIDYSAESPARVINEVMYLLNDKVIHHLAENHPGPATFFFMMSVATFGSNFAPVGALAWMHGAPGYFKLIQSGLAQAFTGYSGPMTGAPGAFHGSIAALLQFKLFTIGTSTLLGAGDKNNDILERMAKNPEEMIAGFVAFVGVGYAMSYIPHIPSMPSNFSFSGKHVSTQVNGVNPFDGYSMVFNSVLTEAVGARAGIMPLTALEYGFLGYKTLLWMNSMTLDGKPTVTPRETATLLETLKKEKILSIKDEVKRNEKIDLILSGMSNGSLSSTAFKANFKQYIHNFITKERPKLKEKIDSIQDATQKERAQWDAILQAQSSKAHDQMNSCERLERAIAMLSDKDLPCAFVKKSEAIQYYNQLSRTFDEYNKDVAAGKYPHHKIIPKEDFLRAFRNKHISTGSNNLLRLLSFYPGYPLRFLWREAQLRLNPSPYVVDKIQSSRTKDAVLRSDWIAIAKMSAYNFTNLLNKVIKATVGALPTVAIIVGIGGKAVFTNIWKGRFDQPIDFRPMSIRLQRLGRFLDNIAIQDSMPWSSQRVNFSKEVHDSSRYDDLISEGQKMSKRLQHNIKPAAVSVSATASSGLGLSTSSRTISPKLVAGLAASTTPPPKPPKPPKLSKESVASIRAEGRAVPPSPPTPTSSSERLSHKI